MVNIMEALGSRSSKTFSLMCLPQHHSLAHEPSKEEHIRLSTPICLQEEETITHALSMCSVASDI